MLVLQRTPGQSVIITVGTDKIKVMLVDIRGHCRARLSFDAPSHITIHREEIQDEIDSGTIGEDYT